MEHFLNYLNQNNFIPLVLPFLIIFILAIFLRKPLSYYFSDYFRSTHHSYLSVLRHAGVRGEYLIFKELQGIKGARLLSSVYLKKRSGEYTEIDVLMLTKNGIFVIESKNYGGEISGFMTARNWTQSIGRRKNQFYNPILQNQAHIKALRYTLNLGTQHFDECIHNVICFSDRANLDKIHLDDDRIIITNHKNIVRDLKKPMRQGKNSFSKEELEAMYERLRKFEHPNRHIVKKQLAHARNRAKIGRREARRERLKFWKKRNRA